MRTKTFGDLLIGVILRNPLLTTASVAILVIVTGGCAGASQEPVPTPETTQESMGCEQYRSIIEEVRIGGIISRPNVDTDHEPEYTQDKIRKIRDSLPYGETGVNRASDSLYASAIQGGDHWQEAAIEMEEACTGIGF